MRFAPNFFSIVELYAGMNTDTEDEMDIFRFCAIAVYDCVLIIAGAGF